MQFYFSSANADRARIKNESFCVFANLDVWEVSASCVNMIFHSRALPGFLVPHFRVGFY